MKTLLIRKQNKQLRGEIDLAGSKSISNRALVIQALCAEPFQIQRLANAKDTDTLTQLLQSDGDYLDVGPAGTTFRFLTALLALKDGTQTLTGSERMQQRPIAVLVDALRQLGANIDYLKNEGYPPLHIHAPRLTATHRLSISASVSSQYISALLLIAPRLPQGLELTLVGKIVSRPYIQMTLNLMAYFGIAYRWEGNQISIAPQPYEARDFIVEADWSAASYYYILAAFADDDLDLQLNGLFENSLQGDAAIVELGAHFGIVSTFNQNGVRLTKRKNAAPAPLSYDFLECPDIAQSLAVLCAGVGVKAHFFGLETLKIKETDRVQALRQELQKVGVLFEGQADESGKLSGSAVFDATPQFATYEDHRMAMAFAPLALLHPVRIEEPEVVVKSYPDFWKDLEILGFEILEMTS